MITLHQFVTDNKKSSTLTDDADLKFSILMKLQIYNSTAEGRTSAEGI